MGISLLTKKDSMIEQPEKRTYDTIVIGSGLGGLIAAARLAMSGQKILVLEQHSIPGGCATNFKRKNFRMEVGLHEMDGLDALDPKREIFEKLDIFNNIELIRLPEFYRTLTESGSFDQTIPEGIVESRAALQKSFPEEAHGIQKYFKVIIGLRTEVMRLNRMPRWLLALSVPIFPLLYPEIIRYRKRSLGWFLNKIFINQELKQILLSNLGYYHDDPDTMSMLYYSVAQGGYYAGGGYYIKGGSGRLSDYLARFIKQYGGEIFLNQQVTEILVKGQSVCGVRFQRSHGRNKKPDIAYGHKVIANAALPTLPDLLPMRESRIIQKSIAKQELSCSLLSVYIGFKRSPHDLGNRHYCTFLTPETFPLLEDLRNNFKADFKRRGFVFVDYSQIDSGLAEAPRSVGSICTVDNYTDWTGLTAQEYKVRKEEVARALFMRMEKLLPGFQDSIEYYEVGTPQTIQRYTLNPSGAVYGFAQIPGQDGLQRVQCKSPIKNLYYASAYTFPGGGFTGAILSGWFCAGQLLQD